MGLHTGPVVVGPLVHDPQRPYTAVGDTLVLATRLQQQAAPDTVLVSAATFALVQAEVQGEAWAAGPSAASPTPASGYVVHGLLRRRPGVPWRGVRPLSRFVGRTQELTLLHERLALAARGQGQAVGLVGEPGMGTSRLLAEFAHRLDEQSVAYCEGHYQQGLTLADDLGMRPLQAHCHLGLGTIYATTSRRSRLALP